MIINIKTRIAIRVFILILMIGLSIAVYINGYKISCDKCEVNFITEAQHGILLKEPLYTPIKLTDLYNNLTINKCIISWDDDNGYFINRV
jgi:hypothetical protein